MRALIALLGARPEQLAPLRDYLPTLLRTADDDKDEWVQVVSGLVSNKLYRAAEKELTRGLGGHDDHAALSAAVLRKTVTEVLTRAKRIIADRINGSGEAGAGAGGRRRSRFVGETPYFGPLEERYASRKQQPPNEEFENAHFDARDNYLKEFEDLAYSWLVGSSTTASNSSASPTNAASVAAAVSFKASVGVVMKPPGTQSHLAPTGPSLAQARRVNLTATDPSIGSDGRRRTSKPMALAQGRAGLQSGAGGPGHHLHLGGHKAASGGGIVGTRGARGSGSGRKMGLMMINVDELQAIEAEKETAKEKAKGKRGRKKAKVAGEEEPLASTGERDAGQQVPQTSAVSNSNTNGRNPAADASESSVSKTSEGEKAKKAAQESRSIPGAGEIDAVAAMMGLGVAGGRGEESGMKGTSYLPPALTTVLASANSLSPEGMQKLESYFQKKMPEGSPQERVKYHEEITTGEGGEQMRVTSYIRLDYNTWMWDRVHKRKRVN